MRDLLSLLDVPSLILYDRRGFQRGGDAQAKSHTQLHTISHMHTGVFSSSWTPSTSAVTNQRE